MRDGMIGVLFAFVVAGVAVGYWLTGRNDEAGDLGREASPKVAKPAEVKRRDGPRRAESSSKGNAAATTKKPAGDVERKSDPTPAPVVDGVTRIVGVISGPDGRPVSGASLKLSRDISDHPSISIQGPERVLTNTAGDGRYRLEGFPSDERFVLRVDHAAFASKRVPMVKATAGRETVIDIRLEPGATLAGRVVDERNLPIDDVEILVFDERQQAADPLDTIERATDTKPDGTFEVRHLRAGRKRVSARKKGRGTATVSGIEIGGKDLAPLNLELGWGASIFGVVVDSQRIPIEKALVSAQALGRERRSLGLYHYPPVRTDDRGRFEVTGLEDGVYSLTCICDGYGRVPKLTKKTGSVDARFVLDPLPVVRGRVVDGDTGEPIRRFTVTLGRGEQLVMPSARLTQSFDSVEGRFEFVNALGGKFYLFARAENYGGGRSQKLASRDGTTIEDVVIRMGRGARAVGRVVDSKGRGVARASVELIPRPGGDAAGFIQDLLGNAARNEIRRVRADGEGFYEFVNVPDGWFGIRAEHSDWAEARTEQSQQVVSGGDIRFPELTLARGGTLTGVVLDKAGKPSPRAKVQFAGQQNRSRRYVVVADAAGKFEIKNMASDLYRVQVLERDGKPAGFEEVFFAGKRPPVVVEDGGTAEIRVK